MLIDENIENICDFERSFTSGILEKYEFCVESFMKELFGDNSVKLAANMYRGYRTTLPEGFFLLEEFGSNLEPREPTFWGWIKKEGNKIICKVSSKNPVE